MIKILLTGQRGRGKDTVADMIRAQVDGVRLAFADALKREVVEMVYRALAGTVPLETLEILLADRALMGPAWQWWGEFRRRINPDYWVEKVDQQYRSYLMDLEQPKAIVITDCRHHNESAWGGENGFLRVRVEGPNHRPGADPRSDTHPSEIHVPDLEVDYVIHNTGTLAELDYQVRSVVGTAHLLEHHERPRD